MSLAVNGHGQIRVQGGRCPHCGGELYPMGLTPREFTALRLLALGLNNRTIAERMAIRERTVETYLVNIYEKMELDGAGANRRLTAVLRYQQYIQEQNGKAQDHLG